MRMDRKPGHVNVDIKKVIENLIWIKVVGVGDHGVGKTCIIKHFCESKFTSGYQPTVGVDYGFKLHEVSGKELRIHLWDLAGNPDYLDVRNELYGSSDAIFMVYDITKQASFENLNHWVKEIEKCGPPKPIVCVIGNKTDLRQQRAVDQGIAKKWAAGHKFSYTETSCMTGDGINNMFNALLEEALAKKVIKTAA